MSKLMALSISTGIICGVWAYFSGMVGLMAWLGFAGCTTYFASGKTGREGLSLTLRQNMFGVLCGTAIIFLVDFFPFESSLLLFSGLITFVMCIAGHSKYLSFIPGTFVGSFSTFAAGGLSLALVISLIIGAFMGLACERGGGWLYNSTTGKKVKDIEMESVEDLL